MKLIITIITILLLFVACATTGTRVTGDKKPELVNSVLDNTDESGIDDPEKIVMLYYKSALANDEVTYSKTLIGNDIKKIDKKWINLNIKYRIIKKVHYDKTELTRYIKELEANGFKYLKEDSEKFKQPKIGDYDIYVEQKYKEYQNIYVYSLRKVGEDWKIYSIFVKDADYE